MPIYRLPREFFFPPPEEAEPSGLLAIGGGLEPQRLVLAYSQGIFPWYSEGQPILWFSPDPRFVLYPEEFHMSRSLKKRIKKRDFVVTFDQDFSSVINQCSKVPRPGQSGTWITNEMIDAYEKLHQLGIAHSVEVYLDKVLVGGLYGICLGNIYFGESMFALVPDASKVGFSYLVRQLEVWGIEMIDSQVHTEHLERFGARHIPRSTYLSIVHDLVGKSRIRQKWSFDEGFFPLQ